MNNPITQYTGNENQLNTLPSTDRSLTIEPVILQEECYCPECNYPVNPEWNYCPICGKCLKSIYISTSYRI